MKKGSLKPEGYIPRLIDSELSRRLDNIGAVEIAGTMWCGKTWTSLAFGESITRVGNQSTRIAAEADPGIVLLGDKPHVIDEWQDVPAIWDEVRASVDQNAGQAGQFILTGSTQPHKDEVHHSGAGRISTLRMRTMSLQETGDSKAQVSLAGLFRGEFKPQLVDQSLSPIAEYIYRGGWPALNNKTSKDVSVFLDSFLDAVFDVNIPTLGLNGSDARKVARSLARNLGSAPTLSTVSQDAGFDTSNPKAASEKASFYIRAFEQLYLIEGITGWDAPIRSKTRLRLKPKYYFADPSLAANLLGVAKDRILEEGQLFGVLFESLCMHELAVYSSILPGAGAEPLHYYRDSDGLEVDAVIELKDGSWGAVEIKLGENKFEDAARSLLRLRSKVLSNPMANNREPAFMAMIVGAGEYARQDKETGIYIIPITTLGA
ncbi:MAG: ATP-binding protein [Clostridiales bacterium]|nr:ATP-binding protein [Clostridiales bacterium]